MKRCFLAFVVLFSLVIAGCTTSSFDPAEFQRTTIKEIQDDPNAWLNVSVVVEGLVQNIVWDDTKRRYIFVFQGKFGNVIKVSASSSPVFGEKYDVWGIVQKDPDRSLPTMVLVGSELIRDRSLPPWVLPLVIALGILILVAGVFLIVLKFRDWKKPKTGVPPVPGEPIQRQDPGETYILPDPPTDMPPTLMYFPGRLKFISGPDKGNEISLIGRQESEGSVVTIGRRPEQGDRKFSHIQIHSSINTVSRMQAEIWHISDQMLLKNLSTKNHTIHNERKLGLNEKVALNDGDIIKMGELELEFRRQ